MSKVLEIARTDQLQFVVPDDSVQIDVRVDRETVWLTQDQMADLFGVDRTSIVKHLRNVYSEGELDEAATCEEISQVRQEGKRRVTRKRPNYNLDAIISVGYRVNSERGTLFRQWATRILKRRLVDDFRQRQRLQAQSMQEIRCFLRSVANKLPCG